MLLEVRLGEPTQLLRRRHVVGVDVREQPPDHRVVPVQPVGEQLGHLRRALSQDLRLLDTQMCDAQVAFAVEHRYG